MPVPPFSEEAARVKVRMAEEAWNSRDPDRVVRVTTPDTRWRNLAEFPVVREAVLRRHASINEQPIRAEERKSHRAHGRRPDEHPGPTELGL